jgi:nitroreductase
MAEIDLYEAMSTLRAVRRLRPDPIPDDVLERLLQAAAWAPSGGNQQPWRVVVVTDPVIKQGLADLYAPEWARFSVGYEARAADLPPDEQAAVMRTLAAGNYLAAHMQDAPVLLVFCFDPRRMAITDADLDRISVIGGASIYPAVQNLMLACVAEGIGCTLTTLHCFREAEVNELLGIREPWGTAALVPIGYPLGGGHGSITRRDARELAYRDRFGAKWTDG